MKQRNIKEGKKYKKTERTTVYSFHLKVDLIE
jgi:hypothetical protein